MKLRLDPSVPACLATLAPRPKKAIRRALEALATDPRPNGYDVKVLDTTTLRCLRLRLGPYRIAYRLDGQTVQVLKVFHRSEGYAWVERLGL